MLPFKNFHLKHHRNMKSSQLIKNSPGYKASHPRILKGLAAIFAGALALGLGANSAFAQGPYYPQVNGVSGTPVPPNAYLTFNFNGVPITSSPEFNVINSNMPPLATLLNPPPAGKHIATTAEYNAAVQAAGQLVASGGAPGITVGSLAARVASYRTATAGATQQALGALAAGVIAANQPTVVAQLGALAFSAAQSNPNGLAGPLLGTVFTNAANSASIPVFNSVAQLASQALAGASSVTSLPPSSISLLVSNAATAVVSVGNGKTVAQRQAAIQAVVLSASSSPVVATSLVNVDAVTRSLVSGTNTNVGSYDLLAMLADIKTSVGGGDPQKGAIAQGALRVFPQSSYGDITGALPGAYVSDLVGAFNSFRYIGTPPALANTLTGSYGAPAVAAAAGTFFNATDTAVATTSLVTNASTVIEGQQVIVKAILANQSADVLVATSSVGLLAGLDRGKIAYSAIRSGRVDSAGRIAKGIVQVIGVDAIAAGLVGTESIRGAADAAPAANKTDAFADIAFNLGNALSANVAFTNAAVTSAINQTIVSTTGSVATAPTYIPVIAAMAGAPAGNRASILLNAQTVVGPANAAAINAGAAMVSAITTNPYANYNETLNRILIGNPADQNLSVLYAASLLNSGDNAGGLAVAVSNTNIPVGDLTRAALSASAAVSGNRGSEAALRVAGDVSVHTKTNPNDIQVYLGRQIITNPTLVKEITTAATVNAPQFSHTIAHTLAFNAPTTAWESVNGIFLHSKVTSVTQIGNLVNDRPAAGAAITAALTTGILENTQLSANDKRLAVQNMITRSITSLHGAIGYSYTDATAGPATFRQSDGTVGGFTLVKAKGVAGGITGFMAQAVAPGDSDITGGATGYVFNALFQAAYAARQLTGTLYMLDIAQAAGQAFGWVSGTPTSGVGATAAANIAQAIFNAGSGQTLLSIRNAVNFGIDEAAGGEIGANPLRKAGAGAAGLRDIVSNPLAPFYDHHSAQGKPVSNIFNL